jgi:hypothetical protein
MLRFPVRARLIMAARSAGGQTARRRLLLNGETAGIIANNMSNSERLTLCREPIRLPIGSRGVLEYRPDGFVLTLRPVGWGSCVVLGLTWAMPGCLVRTLTADGAAPYAAAVCALAALVCLLDILAWGQCEPGRVSVAVRVASLVALVPLIALGAGYRELEATLWVATGLWGLATLGLIVWGLFAAPARYTITVAADRLLIRAARPLGRRRYEWARGDILAVGAWDGLWVVTRDRKQRLLRDRPEEELDWIAARLQQALLVPGEVPPGPEEIRVAYGLDRESPPHYGVLQARPGALTIRRSVADCPHVLFRDRDRSVFRLREQSPYRVLQTLSPTDVTCRIGDDGTACLHVAPLGSKLYFWVACDRPAALEAALGRFWGAKED